MQEAEKKPDCSEFDLLARYKKWMIKK